MDNNKFNFSRFDVEEIIKRTEELNMYAKSLSGQELLLVFLILEIESLKNSLERIASNTWESSLRS